METLTTEVKQEIEVIVDRLLLKELSVIKNQNGKFITLEKILQQHGEAITRQGDEIKHLRELMEHRFAAIDKRFEDMNKRFSALQWMIGLGFAIILAFLKFGG